MLEADGKGFRGEVRVSEKALRKFTAGTRSAAKSTRETAKSTGQLRRQVKRLGETASHAHGKLGGYAALGIVLHRAARAISAVRLNPFFIRAWVQTQGNMRYSSMLIGAKFCIHILHFLDGQGKATIQLQ